MINLRETIALDLYDKSEGVNMKITEQPLSYAEFKKWLIINKDEVQPYFKQNDIDFKNLQISARLYNILRINEKKFNE